MSFFTYCVPHFATHLSLQITKYGTYYLHFTDEEIERLKK